MHGQEHLQADADKGAAFAHSVRMPMIDGHAHVFHRGLPLASGRRYAPTYDATLDAYLAMLDANGFQGGVLVQPSFLGSDNGFLLEAIAAAPSRLRGVAVVDPSIKFHDLEGLAARGIVGLRLNLLGHKAPLFSEEPWRHFIALVAELGLHVEIQAEARRLVSIIPQLLATKALKIVIDHFGLPDPGPGHDDPAFASLLADAGGSERRLWMKLSAPYRLGSEGFMIAAALIPRLKTTFGCDRLLFGTDWPHTRHESPTRVQEAVAAFSNWFPDELERKQVLFDTSAHLFAFPQSLVAVPELHVALHSTAIQFEEHGS